MFIYSLRASTLKFFGVTTLALAALVTLLFFIPTGNAAAVSSDRVVAVEQSGTVKYEKIKTADDRVNFLAQFGWQVDSAPVEEAEVTIPAEFDKVYRSYNELQQKQGFDLSKFHRKSVMRYTYRITNYPSYDGEVLATILIWRNRVVGGDVCSSDSGGFIHGLDPAIEF